ncbi:MAG: aminotransferase class V-fold PLP-dependent enzyme [Candidatus Aminicenantes bacterium]|jgi:selenocysteine lyase/cysteine desulfurase
METYSLESIREQIVGHDLLFDTPFGERHLLYTDYTASGRGFRKIEETIWNIEKSYANTHTEDDYSGKYLTQLLHEAESKIKELVNAGPEGKIIMIGSGTTGALKKLQEIIGVYIPPVTKERISKSIRKTCNTNDKSLEQIEKDRPVVFIGPYEHHTNELMWREAYVEVVVIPFDNEGRIDLYELERQLSHEKYKDRMKIGSFSAGSNITGIRTRVYDIARICHKKGALIFYDFAAVAPYVKIDMNRDEHSFFDAIFFSPHKFLGGPGTSGVLVFNEKIYRKDLPPTTAGGGTVRYVGFEGHDFAEDIEIREKAGTPPILQAIKAALVLDLKEKIGTDRIEAIESAYTEYVIERLKQIDNLEIIGDVSPYRGVSIISFNIQHKDKILHPKFVTKLMNDLFGIQSRAGCSCAGPYGHILLDIDDETSKRFRSQVLKGCEGIKPGWVRVNIHYTLSQDDIDYLLNAITFVARSAYLFLQKYTFDMRTAEWKHIGFEDAIPEFSIDNDFAPKTVNMEDLPRLRETYLEQAKRLASELEKQGDMPFARDDKDIEELKSFYYIHRA